VISLDEIHENDLYITQSRLRDVFRDSDSVVYLKKEFAFEGGHWDGRDIQHVLRRNDNGKTLVLGDSDKEMPEYELHALRMLGGYRNIWSTHAGRIRSNRFRMVPLGLPYDRHYGFPFNIIGNTRLVREAYRTSEPPDTKDVQIMGAFAVENAPERELVRQLVIANPIGFWDAFEVTFEARLRYLRTIRRSGLVACPRGRGIDTYRIWETLYMGAVPIVVRLGNPFRDLLSGLPFIELDSWDQMADIDNLVSQYKELSDYSRNFESLRADLLVSRIESWA